MRGEEAESLVQLLPIAPFLRGGHEDGFHREVVELGVEAVEGGV